PPLCRVVVFVDRAASAATYTLSLHDALPIFAPAVRPVQHRTRPVRHLAGARLLPRRGRRPGRAVRDPDATAECHGGASRRSRTQDRKSTRLNSSHVKTAYAASCLKKKKTAKT